MVLEVVTMTILESGVSEEPLPEVELPKGWVPPKVMTHVWFDLV